MLDFIGGRNMRTHVAILTGLALLSIANDAWAAPAISSEQIKKWRAEGPAAVDRLLAERDQMRKGAEGLKDEALLAANEKITAFNDVIDQVAAAKYSHESGLYWYTDEAEAARQAKLQNKPILTLRLLGNLNEELTCANSRYFRILLYPHPSVRKLLRERFILHWKSVRPVPKITIDLGNGRKVERTISGNSVHYLLLPSGIVLDVFPGLYGPVLFEKRLQQALVAVDEALASNTPKKVVKRYRNAQVEALEKAWAEDLKKYEAELTAKDEQTRVEVGEPPKRFLEFWSTVAGYHPEFGEFDEIATRLIRQEAEETQSVASTANHELGDGHGASLAFAFAKGSTESMLETLMKHCLRRDLATDCVYNEYRGRYVALQWDELLTSHVDGLNEQVYENIFGYSLSDPWLGIAHKFAALPRSGGLEFQPAGEKKSPPPEAPQRPRY
jgi:hypothetical protein